MLALLPLVAGCAAAFDQSGREWAKPNAEAQQVTLDERDCAWNVERLRAPDTVVGGIPDAIVIGVFEARRSADFTHCMTARGYQPRRS